MIMQISQRGRPKGLDREAQALRIAQRAVSANQTLRTNKLGKKEVFSLTKVPTSPKVETSQLPRKDL